MGISLEKKQELVKVILSKRSVPDGIVMQVKVATDVSGSMDMMFRNGTMQELFERLLPIGMRFDDNQSLESYSFSTSAAELSEITVKSINGYANKVVAESTKAGNCWGGTAYASALKLINASLTGGKGLFGFLKKKPTLPTYVIFNTDGDTSGERETEQFLNDMAGSNVYIQLVGVGRGSNFSFLKKMADKFDHVGFATFPDLEHTTDEQLYETLLSEELCQWIKSR